MTQDLPAYWSSRWLLERGLASIYLIAFLAAVNQFIPLVGERGLLPAVRFIRAVPFRSSPSLFYLFPTDAAFRIGGNLSWLNWLTIVLAASTLDDRFLEWLPVSVPALRPTPGAQRVATYALAAVVAVLSVPPTLNMLSSRQMMNTAFNPLQIVNTYGAFGSVTKERDEIVIEGTSDESITDNTVWREYEFKGKPGDPSRMPPQVAPYHLRLDWLMWFAAMSSPSDHPWFPELLLKLLEGDQAVLSLLRTDPFPGAPPKWVRAQLYSYRFTTPAERRATGRWWDRSFVAPYFPAVRLQPH
jgi:hypothetical protein